MLSRVAESIYWMGRQIERAENLARFLEVTLSFDLDQPENVVDPWVPLISVSGDEEEFNKRFSVCNADTVTRFLAFDIDYPNSMLASLKMARQNARGVRECMSSESFELLNDFYHFVSNAAQDQNTKIGSDFFAAVREHALLFNGVFDGTMPRDLAWNFFQLGTHDRTRRQNITHSGRQVLQPVANGLRCGNRNRRLAMVIPAVGDQRI
ncbi:MAG: alpha-E domain-containing protein [Planctomycetota bacterium]